MVIHRHHSTPVHLGGHGPIQLLPAEEHAAEHARRFIEGLDNGFYMGLLFLLPPDLEKAVREEQSRRMKTDWNPGHGTSFVAGRKWFNNGVREVLENEYPEGFVEGRLTQSEETKRKRSKSQTGKHWWNNGTHEVQSPTQPEGYFKGRLPGQKRKRRKG